MNVSFDQINNYLINRVKNLDLAFERHLLDKDGKKYVDRYLLQEGLISSLWQSWGLFCKNLLLGSIRGGITSTGSSIDSPQFSSLNDLQIYYAASCIVKNQNFNSFKQAQPHQEVTWGDVDKIGLLFSGFQTTNSQNIAIIVSGCTLLKDLQSVRNASAHITKHSLSKIISAKVRYSENRFRHPSDAMFWVDPSTRDFLWKSWVDEIILLSSAMIE